MSNLPLIKRLVRMTCRKKRFTRADCEDFEGKVMEKLIEDDYRRLREFKGKGTIEGYLATVVARLGMDYCDHKWGKWRPSTAARSLGTLAIELERLLVRDQVPWAEAVEELKRSFEIHEKDLEELYGQLPSRTPRVFEGEEGLLRLKSQEPQPEERLLREERNRQWEGVARALAEVRGELDDEDQLILSMYFEDGVKLTRIAKALQIEGNIYHRKERIQRKLRRSLRDRGVGADLVGRLFNEELI